MWWWLDKASPSLDSLADNDTDADSVKTTTCFDNLRSYESLSYMYVVVFRDLCFEFLKDFI